MNTVSTMMTPVADNWAVIHKAYMQEVNTIVKEGISRREAIELASVQAGLMMDPVMTGAQFRSWDATLLQQQRKPRPKKRRKAAKKTTKRTAPKQTTALVDDTEFISDFAFELDAKYRPMAVRALKGVKRGARRYIVCKTLTEATQVQRRLPDATRHLGWVLGELTTALLSVEALYEDRPVFLLAIARG